MMTRSWDTAGDWNWVPPPGLLTEAVWREARKSILGCVLEILGPFPEPPGDLEARIESVEDAGDHLRKKVVLLPGSEDPMPAYLLVPKALARPAPAVLCLHSTTKGSGKDLPAGVAGARPGDPPIESRSYALQLVRRGYVTLAPDMLCDGERVADGLTPYDTSRFYGRHPEWSAAGKIIWDSMRAVDYLCTLSIVDTGKIGVIGHSHGAHYSVFAAMFDERIAAVVCNGGVLYWKGICDLRHWARTLPYWQGICGQHRGAPTPATSIPQIPRLHPFYERGEFPCGFWEFISPVAPRALLCMDGEDDGNHWQFRATYAALRGLYEALGEGPDLTWFSYPGGHDFPRAAREKAYSWFDEVLRGGAA